MALARVERPTLLITLGTTHNRPECSLQDWQLSLGTNDADRVVHLRVDTTTLDLNYGYDPRFALHVAVPPEMSDQDLYQDLLGHLRRCCMEENGNLYVPVSTLDGGTGQRNDAVVALANSLAEVRQALEQAFDAILKKTSTALSQPKREADVLVRTFIGSSTGSGLLIPLLFLLREIQRKGIQMHVELHITIPDDSPGFDRLVARMRRANSFSVLLELSALAFANWSCTLPLGAEDIATEKQPLFDKLYIYSMNSPGGTCPDVDRLSLIVARQVELHAENSTGVGLHVRQSKQRTGEVWRHRSPNGNPSILSTAGHAIIRFPRQELAAYFAARNTYEFLDQALAGNSGDASGLWDQVTQGNPDAWRDELYRKFREGLPAIRLSADTIGQPPSSAGASRVRTDASRAFDQWCAGAGGKIADLQEWVQSTVHAAVDASIRSGQLGTVRDTLQGLYQKMREQVAPYLQNLQRRQTTEDAIEAARAAMMAPKAPRGAVDRYVEVVRTYYNQQQEIRFVIHLQQVVTALEQGYSGLVATLQDLDRDMPRYGSVITALRPAASRSPCERYVLRVDDTTDEIETLFEQIGVLWAYGPDGQRVFNPAIQQDLEQTLLTLFRTDGQRVDAATVEATLADFFTGYYWTTLQEYTLADAVRIVNGGSLDRLREDLIWANSTAQGWLVPVTINQHRQNARSEKVVEVGTRSSNDDDLDALVRQTLRGVDIVYGDRGAEDWIVVHEATHGLALDLIPAFRSHGAYYRDYVEEQANWKSDQRRPVHGDKVLEALVADKMQFYLTRPLQPAAGSAGQSANGGAPAAPDGAATGAGQPTNGTGAAAAASGGAGP